MEIKDVLVILIVDEEGTQHNRESGNDESPSRQNRGRLPADSGGDATQNRACGEHLHDRPFRHIE